jgi:hypothetical protein
MAMLDIGFWAEAAMFTIARQGLTDKSKRELIGQSRWVDRRSEYLRLVLSGVDGRVFGLQQEFGCKIKDGDRTALCDKRSAVMGQICAGVGLV